MNSALVVSDRMMALDELGGRVTILAFSLKRVDQKARAKGLANPMMWYLAGEDVYMVSLAVGNVRDGCWLEISGGGFDSLIQHGRLRKRKFERWSFDCTMRMHT